MWISLGNNAQIAYFSLMFSIILSLEARLRHALLRQYCALCVSIRDLRVSERPTNLRLFLGLKISYGSVKGTG